MKTVQTTPEMWERFVAAKKKADLSNAEVSLRGSVGKTSINQFRNCEVLRVETLESLAYGLGISYEELVGPDPQPGPHAHGGRTPKAPDCALDGPCDGENGGKVEESNTDKTLDAILDAFYQESRRKSVPPAQNVDNAEVAHLETGQPLGRCRRVHEVYEYSLGNGMARITLTHGKLSALDIEWNGGETWNCVPEDFPFLSGLCEEVTRLTR